jgi:cell division protein FtsL
MRLGDFARHISKKAEVAGYAADKARANDSLIKPFADFDRQKARLTELQRSTLGLCWIDAKCKAIPYDADAFARVQADIQDLAGKIDHNAKVLDELEANVEELGTGEDMFCLGRMHGEKRKLQERIELIKAQPDKDLAHKWKAVVEVGGDRSMYEALPEVQTARQKAQQEIEPLEAEIARTDRQIQSLENSLKKLKL